MISILELEEEKKTKIIEFHAEFLISFSFVLRKEEEEA